MIIIQVSTKDTNKMVEILRKLKDYEFVNIKVTIEDGNFMIRFW